MHTSEVFLFHGRRVVLIDTPGLYDNTKSVSDLFNIFKTIGVFLEKLHAKRRYDLSKTRIAPFSQNRPYVDTKVASSLVSSISTGSPMIGLVGYREISAYSERFSEIKFSKTQSLSPPGGKE